MVVTAVRLKTTAANFRSTLFLVRFVKIKEIFVGLYDFAKRSREMLQKFGIGSKIG